VSATVQSRSRFGDYRVVRQLAPGSSLLVQDAHGHRLVLKRLSGDCMMADQLHPNIRQRLARVRELADLRVASLRGVERIDGQAFLVWEYIDGEPLADRTGEVSPSLLRDIALSVESLHAHGLVHGAIHARNVILTPHGRLRLTHVSPLLYDDPRDDAVATIEMFHELVRDHAWNHALHELLRCASEQHQPLTWLRNRLSSTSSGESRLSASADGVAQPNSAPEDRAIRRSLHLVAGALVVAAITFSCAFVWWCRRPSSSTQPPPPLRAGNLVSPAVSP
jgi:hypothetical protein